MNFLFLPAEWLSSRLRFRMKLLASFLVFAVPLAAAIALIAWNDRSEVERFARQRAALAGQVQALRVAEAIRALDAARQFGRGTGDASAGLGAAAARLAPAEIGDAGAAAAFEDALQRIRSSGDAEVAASAEVLEALAALRSSAAERSGLLRADDEVARLYVETLANLAPRILSLLGEARQRGVEAVIGKRLTGKQRAGLLVVRSSIDPLVGWTRENLDRIGRARPGSQAALDDAFSSFNTARLALQEFLTTKVIDSIDFDVSPDEYDGRGARAAAELIGFAERLGVEFDRHLAERQAATRARAAAVLAAFAFVVLGIAYLFVGAYRSIMRAVRTLEDAADQLARGDLTARAELAGRDEIAHIGGCFNRVAESFGGLIRQVVSAADQAATTAGTLSRDAQAVTAASASQSESVTRSSGALQELAVSVSEVAAHATGTAGIVAQAVDSSRRGRDALEQAVAQMQDVVGEIRETVDAVRFLDQRSSAVDRVVVVIAEIADQTNLLALNAAIEAARAGESGRGFAVVADEVRKLAERTRQSTREIEATIHSMREGIEKVATSIHAGSERVDAGVRVIAGLSAELQAIQNDIGRSSGLVGEIVDATRAQNDASQGLAREVEAIARTAEANHQAVERTAGMARGLMGVAADLRGAVAGLRV